MSVLQTHLFYIGIIALTSLNVAFAERVRNVKLSIMGFTKSHEYNLTRAVFYLIALIILIIPLVQRNCGADLQTYYFSYTHDRIGQIDALFAYLLAFIHRYISDPKIGYGIISGITVIISLFSLSKARECINVPLSVLSYLTCIYFYSYNYIRMMFAFAFILWGYSICVRGKRKLAIIPFVIAAFFHLSSIIVLLIHIGLLCFKKHSKLVISIGIVGVFAFVLRPYYFLSLITIERYQLLVEASSSSSIGLGTVIRAMPLLYIIWKYREKFRTDYVYVWIVVFAFSNIAFSFFGYFVGSASRISNILLTFHIIFAVPYLVNNDDNNCRRANSTYIFIIYCAFIYALNASNFANIGIVPYY